MGSAGVSAIVDRYEGAVSRPRHVSALDLRIGNGFVGTEADALRRALTDAARTIEFMPATYLIFADGSPILPTSFERTPARMTPPRRR